MIAGAHSPLEAVLRRDRAIIVVALAGVTVLAWLYVVRLASAMDMGGMDMTGFRMLSTGFGMVMAPADRPWTAGEFALMAAMWTVMMIGMMTPSAAPMALIYAGAGRAAPSTRRLAATGWVVAGYLVAWTGFAIVATTAQLLLDRFAWLDPMMASASTPLAGAILIAAGLYQWTPWKNACLASCQMPMVFIQRLGGFRGDVTGAVGLGLRHGFYCIGCCWALMALLFAGGVMNVLWIAALSAFVLAERILPGGAWVSRIAGLGLAMAGVRLLFG